MINLNVVATTLNYLTRQMVDEDLVQVTYDEEYGTMRLSYQVPVLPVNLPVDELEMLPVTYFHLHHQEKNKHVVLNYLNFPLPYLSSLKLDHLFHLLVVLVILVNFQGPVRVQLLMNKSGPRYETRKTARCGIRTESC